MVAVRILGRFAKIRMISILYVGFFVLRKLYIDISHFLSGNKKRVCTTLFSLCPGVCQLIQLIAFTKQVYVKH